MQSSSLFLSNTRRVLRVHNLHWAGIPSKVLNGCSEYWKFYFIFSLTYLNLWTHILISQNVLSLQTLPIFVPYFFYLLTFSKFYRKYYDLISKFRIGLKSLLCHGLSEPKIYGDLVYRLKKIVDFNNFSAPFIKIYNINILQQTA